jgi:hypothetical protein
LNAREIGLNKSKASKESKSPAKKSPAPKPHDDPWNVKGSVTLYLEAKSGKAYTEVELIEEGLLFLCKAEEDISRSMDFPST